MRKKWWKIGLTAAAVAALLAGCAKQTEEKETTPGKENTAENTEEADQEEQEKKEPRYAPYFPDKVFEASGKVWIAGDSIASAHDDNEYVVPISGWGEYLANYLDGAEVHNEARSGRSSKSYVREQNYDEIMEHIGYGDYLFIAFGLNDEEESTKLHTDAEAATDAEGSFTGYLKESYIEPALKAGAEPVLLSPVVRATYDENGQLTEQTQIPYVEAIERLVEEYRQQGIDLYYIDLYGITKEWYDEIGEEAVRELHGVDNEGNADTTHFSEKGAEELAEKIVEEVKRQQMELSAFIK